MSEAAVQFLALRAMLESEWAQSIYTEGELRQLVWLYAVALLTP